MILTHLLQTMLESCTAPCKETITLSIFYSSLCFLPLIKHKVTSISYYLLLSRPMFAIPGHADLPIGPADLSVHVQRAPLVAILVFIDVCPLIAHAFKHQPKRPRCACAGELPFDEHAERCPIIRAIHCIGAE